jgi:hypothetical protein
VTDPVFDAELRSILGKEVSVVSMLDPISLPVNREWLMREVSAALEILRRDYDANLAAQLPDTKEHFIQAWENLEQQHIDFLEWLGQNPDPEVWISLYPKGNVMGEWDTSGDELKLVDPEQDPDLPF